MGCTVRPGNRERQMSTINTTFADNLGREFAAQINANPAEAQNWSELDRNDELPEFDYVALRDHYGFRDMEPASVREVEQAYRDGFNAVFAPLGA